MKWNKKCFLPKTERLKHQRFSFTPASMCQAEKLEFNLENRLKLEETKNRTWTTIPRLIHCHLDASESSVMRTFSTPIWSIRSITMPSVERSSSMERSSIGRHFWCSLRWSGSYIGKGETSKTYSIQRQSSMGTQSSIGTLKICGHVPKSTSEP